MERIENIKKASRKIEELISDWENKLMDLTEEQIDIICSTIRNMKK